MGLGLNRWHWKNYAKYLLCHSGLSLVPALEFLCLCCSLGGVPECQTNAAAGLRGKVSYPRAWEGTQACGHCDRDLLRNLNIPGDLQAAWVSAGSPVTLEQILGS